jgi:hypothetical protein
MTSARPARESKFRLRFASLSGMLTSQCSPSVGVGGSLSSSLSGLVKEGENFNYKQKLAWKNVTFLDSSSDCGIKLVLLRHDRRGPHP